MVDAADPFVHEALAIEWLFAADDDLTGIIGEKIALGAEDFRVNGGVAGCGEVFVALAAELDFEVIAIILPQKANS